MEANDDNTGGFFDSNAFVRDLRRKRRSSHTSVSDKNVLRSRSLRPGGKGPDCFPAIRSDASGYWTVSLFAGRIRGHVREPDLQRL
jgi:hypothetical protein